jgi:hypothetical protein
VRSIVRNAGGRTLALLTRSIRRLELCDDVARISRYEIIDSGGGPRHTEAI